MWTATTSLHLFPEEAIFTILRAAGRVCNWKVLEAQHKLRLLGVSPA